MGRRRGTRVRVDKGRVRSDRTGARKATRPNGDPRARSADIIEIHGHSFYVYPDQRVYRDTRKGLVRVKRPHVIHAVLEEHGRQMKTPEWAEAVKRQAEQAERARQRKMEELEQWRRRRKLKRLAAAGAAFVAAVALITWLALRGFQ